MLIFLLLNEKLYISMCVLQSASRVYIYLHLKMQSIWQKLLHLMKSVVKNYDKGP